MRSRLRSNQRGAALIEAAMTLPLILLVSVAIFEFGRAYQTWQVLTNAAREGARVAVIAGTTDARGRSHRAALHDHRQPVEGHAPRRCCSTATSRSASSTGSQVTINYPFQFMVLNPVRGWSSGLPPLGAPLTMSAVAVMRNES